MRIQVIGTSDTARALIAQLGAAGHVVSDQAPLLTVTIEAKAGESAITVDGPDCRFAHLVAYRIADLAPDGGGVWIQTEKNRDDRAIRVVVPTGDALASHAVELGLTRAVSQWLQAEHEIQHASAPTTILSRRLDGIQNDLTEIRLRFDRPLWRKLLGLGPRREQA